MFKLKAIWKILTHKNWELFTTDESFNIQMFNIYAQRISEHGYYVHAEVMDNECNTILNEEYDR